MNEVLKNRALEKVEKFFADQSDVHGYDVSGTIPGEKFSISEESEHVWLSEIAGDDAFLNEVDIDTVSAQVFNVIDNEFTDLVASRTDTDKNDRQTTAIDGITGVKYTCEETNHDTHVRFSTLNKWALAPNHKGFQLKVESRRANAQREDFLKIGWNGEKVAVETNKEENPLGQDVNIGWIKNIETHAPTRIIDCEAEGIFIGEGGLSSVDAAALYMKDLLDEKYHVNLRLYGKSNFFTDRNIRLSEKSHASDIVSGAVAETMTVVGGDIIARSPRYMPADMLVLTPVKNLAIRVQEGSQRKGFYVNHKRSRFENYSTQNEAFPVSRYDAIIVLKNLKFKKSDTEGA